LSQNLQYTFFRVSTSAPGVASDELNQFVNSHRVTHVEKHFHAEGSEGYWSFCLQWQSRTTGTTESASSKDMPKLDYKTILSTEQFAVFSTLRAQRKQLAEKDGVPVYAVATNEQLASMVRDNVSSNAQLLRIAGFGSSKVERYGAAFIKLIRECGENLGTQGTQAVADSPTHPTN
jgi:superfamily II DNA helicase RecQ